MALQVIGTYKSHINTKLSINITKYKSKQNILKSQNIYEVAKGREI